MPPLLSLAAGVVQELPPERAVLAAAEAGFPAVGLWCDAAHWTPARTAAVRRALETSGLEALDLEVVWLAPGEADTAHDRTVALAGEVSARHVLCVSAEPDPADSKRRFAHLCRRAEDAGVRVVLEFLRLTRVRSLPDALDVVTDVGHPAGGVLVDALHLARSGGTPDDVAAVDPRWLPYAQLCDAAAEPAGSDFEDAMYERRLPGEGELPLRALLDALPPGRPLSLELRSRALARRFPDPAARGRALLDATRRFLAAGGGVGRGPTAGLGG